MIAFETIIAISIGIGLSAACGFRVFVPMLLVGIAEKAEFLTVSESFVWVGTWPAILAFAAATLIEIGAYYFPWLDNLLDTVATPAAVIAGIIVSAACVTDIHPMLRWSLAIIAGGGVAGTVKTGLAAVRLGSTASTGGVANPAVSTFEWITSVALSILAFVVPILAALIAIVLAVFLLRFAWKAAARYRQTEAAAAEPAKNE